MPLHATRCTGRQQEADPWLACTAVVGRAHGALKDASVLAPGGLSQEQSTRSPAGGQPEASLLTMPLTEVMEGWGLRGSQGAIRVTRKRNNGERETDVPRPANPQKPESTRTGRIQPRPRALPTWSPHGAPQLQQPEQPTHKPETPSACWGDMVPAHSPVCEVGVRGVGGATSWVPRRRPEAVEGRPRAAGFRECLSRSSRSRRSRSASSAARLAPCKGNRVRPE